MRHSPKVPAVSRTKIFHVITKLELGGAQEVTLMTLERLHPERYELGLVTSSEGLLVPRAKQIPNLKKYWMDTMVREVHPIKDLLTFFKMWRLFRRERPHIVHTHSSKGGVLGRWAAWVAGVPVIYHTAHGFGFHDYQRPAVRNFYIWLERMTTKITTRIVVVSYANADRGEKAGVFKRQDWVLCRDAIPVADFLAGGPRRTKLSEWKIPDDRVVIGMVACFKPQKAPIDFVDLAATVLKTTNHAHFVMAGDGELRPAVEARIRHHGIERNVTLLGWQHDMPEVYRNLDIAVLTSLWEGLPCVFSEAMASGLPVVATDVDGASEAIVHGENGFLHKPHDVEGLAASVLELISNPDMRIIMGERGKARVAEFDIGTSVARLESAYKECLKSL